MELRAAMSHVWVRAIVVSLAFLMLVIGLFMLGATLLEDGHRGIGRWVLWFEMAFILIAVFIGPAWVVAPSTGTPGDGPPRGGIVPLPVRTPEQSGAGAGDDVQPAA